MYREAQIVDYLHLMGRKPVGKNDEEILRQQEEQAHVARLHLIPFTGEQAKIGFQALNSGKKFTDLVLDYGFHPDIARSIALSWVEMTESFVVTKPTIDAIDKMPLDGNLQGSIRDEHQLLEAMTATFENAACKVCKGVSPTYCRNCVSKAIFSARSDERMKLSTPASKPSDD